MTLLRVSAAALFLGVASSTDAGDRVMEAKDIPGIRQAQDPQVSPDGQLVVYISGEVGRDEVFLTTLPSGEGKWQISTEGGGWTRITPGGDAVVYRALTGDFMSVPISTAGGEIKF